jgi:hypothetical protein
MAWWNTEIFYNINRKDTEAKERKDMWNLKSLLKLSEENLNILKTACQAELNFWEWRQIWDSSWSKRKKAVVHYVMREWKQFHMSLLLLEG